jgi:hypothetical protein
VPSDGSRLGVIMNYYLSAEDGGRKFFVVGVNQRIHSLLEMTKVDSVLKMTDTVQAAESTGLNSSTLRQHSTRKPEAEKSKRRGFRDRRRVRGSIYRDRISQASCICAGLVT